jgi:hypothetical protein
MWIVTAHSQSECLYLPEKCISNKEMKEISQVTASSILYYNSVQIKEVHSEEA